jgi:hypothetical protein
MSIIKNVVKTFFNTINEDVSASEMAFFKLRYEKNAVLAFFFNSFMKKIAETHYFIGKCRFGIFFQSLYEKIAETVFFHIISWKNAVSAFFSLLL